LWIVQGAILIGGSVMSGHSQWRYVGVVLAIVGIVVLAWTYRRR